MSQFQMSQNKTGNVLHLSIIQAIIQFNIVHHVHWP